MCLATLLHYDECWLDDAFVNTRKELEDEQMKRFKGEQDQINHMKDYIAKFGQGNSKMAKQAQSKEKTLSKMVRGGLTEKVCDYILTQHMCRCYRHITCVYC